ncbi:MAG TPA: helix-turn-helix transcriptional regulator, partial [Micromonosporaceae bacterium]
VVRHLVGSGPSVLVAEDLHALDAASLNLLAALAATPDLPALLIVTSRPPATDAPTSDLVASTLARMCGSPGSVRVHLRPWGRDEVADALIQAYPGRTITDHIVDAALRRTGGIAYRLYELLADVGGRDPAMLAEPEPERDEPAGRPAHGPLTAREQDVLACVASGMANKQIARSLGISVRTVAVHVSNVLRKTGTACRTDAALWAVRQETTDGASQSADQPEGADAAPALAR